MAGKDWKSEFEDSYQTLKSAIRSNKRAPVEQAELDRSTAGAFPGGPDLKPGDCVQDPSLGRCLVHKIEDLYVHMAPTNGSVIKLSLHTSFFTPDSIEKGGQRIFLMSPGE